MTEHLGYETNEPKGRASGNSRNGTSDKTVHTDVGPVDLKIPRDRAGSFSPKIVPKHARRLGGFDEAVLSLYAKGLSTGEICRHLEEIYGTEVSKDTISRITDAVNAEVAEWQNRPLEPIWPVIFIDAIVVKIRDGVVANRPIYVVLGINTEGERDVLGLWVGTGGEGAKHWAQILTELRNRGVQDVLWKDVWGEFIPFLSFPPEIRAVIYTTNAIESLNARFRRATRIRGHFPNEQAAIKVLYLTIRERDEKGGSVIGQVRNWKQVLNVLALHYGDRIIL